MGRIAVYVVIDNGKEVLDNVVVRNFSSEAQDFLVLDTPIREFLRMIVAIRVRQIDDRGQVSHFIDDHGRREHDVPRPGTEVFLFQRNFQRNKTRPDYPGTHVHVIHPSIRYSLLHRRQIITVNYSNKMH